MYLTKFQRNGKRTFKMISRTGSHGEIQLGRRNRSSEIVLSTFGYFRGANSNQIDGISKSAVGGSSSGSTRRKAFQGTGRGIGYQCRTVNGRSDVGRSIEGEHIEAGDNYESHDGILNTGLSAETRH